MRRPSENRSGLKGFSRRALLPGEFGNGSKMKFVAKRCWWRSTTCVAAEAFVLA